jgi:hypothetical protein
MSYIKKIYKPDRLNHFQIILNSLYKNAEGGYKFPLGKYRKSALNYAVTSPSAYFPVHFSLTSNH